MLPRHTLPICSALALMFGAAFPARAQNAKSQQATSGHGAESIPGMVRPENPGNCAGCDDCQPKSCGSCLSKLCDWIGYVPMRTGSTFGYPRTWKRRPDLYLYFRTPCRPVAPAAGICEPCMRYVPATGFSRDGFGSQLPQPTAIGSIKE